jgi:TolB protein
MTNPGVIPGFTVVSDAEQGEGLFPKWSSDGTRLAYISRKNITSSTICFTNERRTKVDCLRNDDLGVDLVFGVDWAPDGKRLVFYGQKARSANEIYIANVDGSGVKNLTNHAGNDEMPNWSP